MPDPIKSNSPDTFLRRKNLKGADASTAANADQPLKSHGDLDTLYQPKESTTRDTDLDNENNEPGI